MSDPIMNRNPAGLYKPFKAQALSLNKCFLCGVALDGSNRSREHTFPQWLLHGFELWNKRLTLLNGTPIEYRSLTIPCCQPCNTGPLSRLEQEVSRAVDGGFAAFSELDPALLYQWLLKIFYSVQFKELFLAMDRANPEAGSILSKEWLDQLNLCHVFLQGIRFETKFDGDVPWSILRYRCHEDANVAENFDFRDSPVGLTLGMRMGSVGVIACLQDNHAIEDDFSDEFTVFQEKPLYPIQFDELMAQVFYKRYLINRVPKYVIISPNDGSNRLHVAGLPLQGFSSAPIYNEWKQEEYARMLAGVTGLQLDDVFRSPDQVATWLRNSDGSIRWMDAPEEGISYD